MSDPMDRLQTSGKTPKLNINVGRALPLDDPMEDDDDDDDDSVIFISESPLGDVIFVKEQSVTKTAPLGNHAGVIFKSLPSEIHQNIVKFLPTDIDVANYAILCKKTAGSVSSSVWRQRFVQTFDMVEGFTSEEVAKKYAFRRSISHRWTCFDLGRFRGRLTRESMKDQKFNQNWCLELLKDLILDSNACNAVDSRGKEIVVGLNMNYIRDMITEGGGQEGYTDIVDAILNTDNEWDMGKVISTRSKKGLVLIIQLCLTSFSLDPQYCNARHSHFDASQAQAYALPSKQPVFLGVWKDELNVRWVLHVVNFFKFHLKAGGGEGLMAQEYEYLEPEQLPQPWLGKLKAGTQLLGGHWKGAYTFLSPDELWKIRHSKHTDEIFVDDLDGSEFLQDLSIFFDDDKFSASSWPQPWEHILHGDPFSEAGTSGKRSSRRSKPDRPDVKHFYGTSQGSRTAHFFGRLHALPPQQDIIGFQRVTMMKFFPTMGQYDESQVWGYEGCVLPGGRVIVGRWWDARADPTDRHNNMSSGPFIFWNVNKSSADPQIDGEEALDFLGSIDDPPLMGV